MKRFTELPRRGERGGGAGGRARGYQRGRLRALATPVNNDASRRKKNTIKPCKTGQGPGDYESSPTADASISLSFRDR